MIVFRCPHCNVVHEMPESCTGTLISYHVCQLHFTCPDQNLARRSLAGEVHAEPRRGGMLAGIVQRVKGMFARKCP
jgi:hypothetical protein